MSDAKTQVFVNIEIHYGGLTVSRDFGVPIGTSRNQAAKEIDQLLTLLGVPAAQPYTISPFYDPQTNQTTQYKYPTPTWTERV